MRGQRRAHSSLALLCAVGLAVAGRAHAQGPSLETAVKATYLSKLGAFVGWPQGAFDGPAAPMRLCVAGEDPFGALLDDVIRGQRIDTHPVVVVRLDHVDRTDGCHILFIGAMRQQPVADVLDKMRGAPVLTVTDGVVDPAGRGIVDFVLKDNRVRFRINDPAAAQSGLVISSKLLGLALRPGP
jgi:hypothetical protein